MKTHFFYLFIKKLENALLRADASLSRVFFRVSSGYSLHNRDHDIRNRIIHDQHNDTCSLFLGKYPLSHNGCEIIAVHNAKILINRNDLSLSDEIGLFIGQKAVIGGILFRGFFGSNPFSLSRILPAENITHEKVSSDFLSRPGIYIVSYWNGFDFLSPLHTVAVRVSVDGQITVFNGSPALLSDCRRFICGYRLSFDV